MGYHFRIMYKPRATNTMADALSREHVTIAELGVMVSIEGVEWHEVKIHIKGDHFIHN